MEKIRWNSRWSSTTLRKNECQRLYKLYTAIYKRSGSFILFFMSYTHAASYRIANSKYGFYSPAVNQYQETTFKAFFLIRMTLTVEHSMSNL